MHGIVLQQVKLQSLILPTIFIGILGTLVLLVLILMLIFLAKKIAISIAIIKEASKLVLLYT